MFFNYVKIAWRYLMREKVISMISIVSLSLGIACALVVFVFIQHEWIRDDFHVNGERIFRLHGTNEAGKNEWERIFATLPSDLGPELKVAFPEIESTLRWAGRWGRLRRGDFTSRFDIAYVDIGLQVLNLKK